MHLLEMPTISPLPRRYRERWAGGKRAFSPPARHEPPRRTPMPKSPLPVLFWERVAAVSCRVRAGPGAAQSPIPAVHPLSPPLFRITIFCHTFAESPVVSVSTSSTEARTTGSSKFWA